MGPIRALTALFIAGAHALTFVAPTLAEEACVDDAAAPSGSATAVSAFQQAAALQSTGDARGAADAYARSRQLAETNGDPTLAMLAAANATRALVVTAEHDAEALAKAIEGLDAQLAAAQRISDAAVRAQVQLHLGRTLLDVTTALRDASGDEARATRERAFEGAARALAESGASAARAEDRLTASYAQGYQGRLYEDRGHLDDAMRLSRRALLDALAVDAPQSLYHWQWQIARIEHARGHEAEALEAYRQTAATLAQIRQQTGMGAEAGLAFRASVEPIYEGLVDLLLRRAAATDDDEARQPLLAEARNALEDLKAAELRDYFRDACLDSERKAAPDVIPGAVVVYPVMLEDRLEMIVSRGGRLDRYASAIGRAQLEKEVRAFRYKLERRTTRQYLAQAYSLYDRLIRPIEPALDPMPEVLVFVPAGLLRTIPLAALRDRESGRFLVERVPVAITPSLTLTDPRPIDRKKVRVLSAGITEAVQGYPALESVGLEIETLSGLFPGETLLNDQFRIDAFSNAITERPFGIVHIASHAEFAGDSSESFLLAYDQKLSIDRLAALVATTRFRADEPLELLTLSACESAAGDERAALGIAGVALQSGARSALATLWSVNDEASADLVSIFYEQLADPGVSRARALQRAQIALLQTPHFAHPGYWSPFLMISNWL